MKLAGPVAKTKTQHPEGKRDAKPRGPSKNIGSQDNFYYSYVNAEKGAEPGFKAAAGFKRGSWSMWSPEARHAQEPCSCSIP